MVEKPKSFTVTVQRFLWIIMALLTALPSVQAFLSPLQRALPHHLQYQRDPNDIDPDSVVTATTTTTYGPTSDVEYHVVTNDDAITTTAPTTKALSLSKLVKEHFDLQTPDDDVLDLHEGQRLVCIGDVHGDVQALRDMLHVAGLIDDTVHEDDESETQQALQWKGGDTILVQNGDVLDRGDTELSCWKVLVQLSHQAAQQGGAVIVLWGNHEAMNCQGQFHYTTGEEEYEQFIALSKFNDDDDNDSHDSDSVIDLNQQVSETNTGSFIDMCSIPLLGNQPARVAMYRPGGGLLVKPLLSRLKVAVKVGRTVCVHAGLTSSHLDKYGGLAGMNRQARAWVQGITSSSSSGLPECLVVSNGPVWMRDYSYPPNVEPTNPMAQVQVDAALFTAGADRMVVGHTVQTEGINAALGGKVWRIDVGASRGVSSGAAEVLQVIKRNGREVVSVLSANKDKDEQLMAPECQARSQGIVESVTQAVTDTVAIPVAEALLGVEVDR